MAIDHEAHKIRIKAVSDKMNHPMEYNDAGAPKMDTRDYDREKKFSGLSKKEFEDRMRKNGRIP